MRGWLTEKVKFFSALFTFTLNSVYNDYVYNYIPVIAIEFHGSDASV